MSQNKTNPPKTTTNPNPANPKPTTLYAGLDVAKATLDLAFLGRAEQLPNDAKGHAQLRRRLQKIAPGQQAHVIVEASGGYEQGAVRMLQEAEIAVSVLQPVRVRAFAKAKGLRAKTDPIDASVLACFGQAIQPPPTLPPTVQQRRLCALITRRQQLVESATAEKNRSAHYEEPLLDQQATRLLAEYQKQIQACEKAIAELIASDEHLRQRSDRLQEVKGVGKIVAATLLAEMPELGTLEESSAAALAGVAPYNCDSGPFQGTRRIGGGRATARCALYMAALSTVRHDEVLQRFYQRLLQRGKKPLVALTAVMRKLIILLNRLLKNPNFHLRTTTSQPELCSPQTAGSGAALAPVDCSIN
jgi:transposase